MDSLPSLWNWLVKRRTLSTANWLTNWKLHWYWLRVVVPSLKSQLQVCKTLKRKEMKHWHCWPKGKQLLLWLLIVNCTLIVFAPFLVHLVSREEMTTPQNLLSSRSWLLGLQERCTRGTCLSLTTRFICERQFVKNCYLSVIVFVWSHSGNWGIKRIKEIQQEKQLNKRQVWKMASDFELTRSTRGGSSWSRMFQVTLSSIGMSG